MSFGGEGGDLGEAEQGTSSQQAPPADQDLESFIATMPDAAADVDSSLQLQSWAWDDSSHPAGDFSAASANARIFPPLDEEWLQQGVPGGVPTGAGFPTPQERQNAHSLVAAWQQAQPPPQAPPHHSEHFSAISAQHTQQGFYQQQHMNHPDGLPSSAAILELGSSFPASDLTPQRPIFTTQTTSSSAGDTDGPAQSDRKRSVAESEEADEGAAKSKVQRRQGVTCDQCRSKHLRCDLAEQRAEADARGERPLEETEKEHDLLTVKCSRCRERNLPCSRSHAPPSRRYPRPSRTGKRIEMARAMHGSLGGGMSSTRAALEDQIEEIILSPQLSSARYGDGRLHSRVMAGSVSLRLLTCFFATAHIQMPVVEFTTFATKFNLAQGNPRLMSIMSNGGSAEEGIPSIPIEAPGLRHPKWPGTNESTISTPGTTETLIACMHAWAAHYTDMPIAFGSQAAALGVGLLDGTASDGSTSAGGLRIRHGNQLGGDDEKTLPQFMADSDGGGSASGSASGSAATGDRRPSSVGSGVQESPQSAPDDLVNGKRPKRKQGVACDTCRLRRVRCDVTERPEGTGCSRCVDKRIVCTQDYINQKRKASGLAPMAPAPGAAPLPAAADPAAAGSSAGQGPASWDKTTESEFWVDPGPTAPLRFTTEQARELLAFGRARRAFCQDLLARAISLVQKHGLLHKPSVEGVQALLLLTHIVDLVDAPSSPIISSTAHSHLRALGLERSHEVSEEDAEAVAALTRHLQRTRIWSCAWTYDGIFQMTQRARANYAADTAIAILGENGDRNLQQVKLSAPQAEPMGATPAAPDEAPGLAGQVGLALSVVAFVQVGALSRFIARHIDIIPDNASPGDFIPPHARFSPRPTSHELAKLDRACSAVWHSSDSLLSFFDRTFEQGRQLMRRIRAFQPLAWLTSMKVSAALMELAIYRVLGERFSLNQAWQAQVRSTLGASALHQADIDRGDALRRLLDRSRDRALASCRRVALMVELLLPQRVFQTGGVVVSQLYALAQFMARYPVVSSGGGGGAQPPESSAWQTSDPTLQQTGIDPRQLLEASPSGTGSQGGASEHSFSSFAPSEGGLGPFTEEVRQRSVKALIKALAQLGYAFDMGQSVDELEALLRRPSSAMNPPPMTGTGAPDSPTTVQPTQAL